MIHTIHIPNWRPTSANKMRSAAHWAQVNRMKNSDMQMIGAYAHKEKIPHAKSRRKVEIIIGVVRGRTPDPDAFHKSTHDALTRLKMLVDDSDEWMEMTPNQFVRGKDRFTTIRLTDL